jgi:hypothetical protein
MGWFHGIYTTARMLFGRKEGRERRTLFSDHHADVDSSLRMDCWKLEGSLAF